MFPTSHILLAVLSLLTLASAASPTSFCKCTCFTNSTIIPLDAPRSLPSRPGEALFHRAPPAEGSHEDRKEFRAGNCNDCNRQYCIDAHLPICKDAGVNDIVATCFQRDSRKDEAVVFIFIFATAGLLGWAAVKPWVEKWVESARERRNYIPVPNQGHS